MEQKISGESCVFFQTESLNFKTQLLISLNQASIFFFLPLSHMQIGSVLATRKIISYIYCSQTKGLNFHAK